MRLTLEQAIAYIEDDELVEVTPRHIRLRKRFLDPHERKRQSRQAAGCLPHSRRARFAFCKDGFAIHGSGCVARLAKACICSPSD